MEKRAVPKSPEEGLLSPSPSVCSALTWNQTGFCPVLSRALPSLSCLLLRHPKRKHEPGILLPSSQWYPIITWVHKRLGTTPAIPDPVVSHPRKHELRTLQTEFCLPGAACQILGTPVGEADMPHGRQSEEIDIYVQVNEIHLIQHANCKSKWPDII